MADACSINGSMRARRKANEKIVCVSLPDVPDRRPVGSGKRGGAAGVFHRRAGRSGLRHPTSFEPVITADGGARKNEDISKNAALIPPGFGTASADTLNTGTPLTPNLAPDTMPATGAAVNGTSAPVFVPGSTIPTVNTPADPETSAPSTGYTEVTSDLYYSGGHLGTLKIPAIGLTVKVYEGTDSKTLAKGAGHFEETSIWRGNIAVAAHNRGTNNHFGKIHTLELGDEITLTTKLGTRTYEVVSVSKVLETDRSGLAATTENMITLYTCVMNQRDYRWCVKAVEI